MIRRVPLDTKTTTMSQIIHSMRVTSDRVLHPGDHDPSPGTIDIDTKTGRIVDARRHRATDADIDFGSLVIMPGLVDAHVHLNEPGRTDWEGFETGTKAAVSGGVTTLVDMPLNAIPPTTTVDNLETKLAAARGQCHADVGFWGGVIPGNTAELGPLVKCGVRGFKCFTIDSGVEEFPAVSSEDIAQAMAALEGTGTILMFHAELDAKVDSPEQHSGTSPVDVVDDEQYETFLASRPQRFEVDAITEILRLARGHPDLRLHIVHLAADQAMPLLREAKQDGVHITAETCFHYLTFAASEIPACATQYKCCPPIRSGDSRDALWDAIREGLITTVVSDHSPCTVDLKKGSFMNAWGGVSALGLGLSILWTEGESRQLSLGDIARLTAENTARQVRLWPRKGGLVQGADADLCIFDADALWTVNQEDLHFKNKVSPYLGRRLRGRVVETWLRGRRVWSRQAGWTAASGDLLLQDAEGAEG